MTRITALLVAIPLATASWLGAHCLAYWLVSPGVEHGMGMHAEQGHAWLGYGPALALWGLTVVLAGLVLCVSAGLRGHRSRRPPALLFALLPPAGFVLQEYAERLLASGSISGGLVAEPAFLVGLALQVPFAVAALLLTRALYGLGFGLGRALAASTPGVGRPLLHAPPPLPLQPASATPVSPSLLALGHGQRAPPATSRP